MIPRVLLVCAMTYFLLKQVQGELVQERSPECPEDNAVFRCTATNGRLDWLWGSIQQFVYFSGVSNPGIRTLRIQGVTVVLNATAIGLTINAVATVPNPLSLNGLLMTCNGQQLMIDITFTNFLPTALSISLTKNVITIFPNVVNNSSSIYYELFQGTLMKLTQQIMVNSSDVITFFQCQDNITFCLDIVCPLNDESDEERKYTLFSNDTWTIPRSCGDIQVNCTNGNWSEDINCPEFITSPPELNTTDEEFEEVITTTCTQVFNELRRYEEVIGSVIGTFVLTLILGITLGFACGINYNRTMSNRQSKDRSASIKDINNSKGALYEEIELDNTVKLSQNISYDVVKKV